MTERPQPSPEQLARLAALRHQRPAEVALTPAATPRPTRRTKPAQLSKIVTAGLSTSLVLGLVTAMGWSATSTGASDTGSTPQPAVGPIVLAPSQPLADPTVLITAPVTVPASVGAAPVADPTTVPVAAVPVTAAPVPVVIDVAVPAPQPVAQPAPSGGSNGQTKQSK